MGCQFVDIVNTAREDTWNNLARELEEWIERSPQAGRAIVDGMLHSYMTTMLDVVVLESLVDLSNKTNGLIVRYASELEEWIERSPPPGRAPGRAIVDGMLHSYMTTLLRVVVLESDVDITNKINGLIVRYHAEIDIEVVFKTLLMEAIFNKKNEAAIALMDHGADPNKRFSTIARNMFVFAAENNLVDVFKKMTVCGARLNQINSPGENALVVSVRKGHLEITEYLLEKGMNPNYCTYPDHMTLLHCAVKNRAATSTAMIQFLLDKGADPHIRSFWPVDYDERGQIACGFTPLQFLEDTSNGVSRHHPFSNNELVVAKRNAELLSHKMIQDVRERQVALCMVSNNRLSSSENCLLSTLSGEPYLLRLIMKELAESFDTNHPRNPLLPTEYTGVVGGDE